jgi:hypothetical protein
MELVTEVTNGDRDLVFYCQRERSDEYQCFLTCQEREVYMKRNGGHYTTWVSNIYEK